jgi:hypothetical protein
MTRELELQGTPLKLRRLMFSRLPLLCIQPDMKDLDWPPADASSERSPSHHELQDDEIFDGSQLIALEWVTVPHVLDALAMSLRAKPVSPMYEVRPTKMNVTNRNSKENPERTFYAKAVAHFFLTHGGVGHYDLVARTVSALLDLHDDPMDMRHAQLISESLEDHFIDEDDIDWSTECD